MCECLSMQIFCIEINAFNIYLSIVTVSKNGLIKNYHDCESKKKTGTVPKPCDMSQYFNQIIFALL